MIRILWQDYLCSRVKGLKTVSMEPGSLNEKRSNEVNSTSIAVTGEEVNLSHRMWQVRERRPLRFL